jgi:hypothetical protein
MTAWQAERRRAQSSKFQSENARALANLIGAVGDAGDYVEGIDEKKRKREQEDASLGMLRAKTGAAKTDAESSLLKAKADEAASQEKLLRTKSDSEEKSARITREAAAAEEKARPQKIANAATDVESEISMPGGVSQAQLEQIAVERGLPAKDWRTVLNERDANVDKTNREAAEMANLSAQTAQREAAAKKASRPPAPKVLTPDEIEERELRKRKLRAEVGQLEGKPEAAAAAAEKLTPAQAEDVANIVGARRALARISSEAQKTDPNILKSLWNSAISTVGVDGPLTGYVAEVRNFNSAVGAMRSGASIGVAEQKRLDSFLVAPGDTVGTVESKKAAFEQYLNDKEAGLNAVRGIQGQAPIQIPQPAAPAAPAASAPAASAKVRVSNGQEILEIDKADLGDALADGYKVVR